MGLLRELKTHFGGPVRTQGQGSPTAPPTPQFAQLPEDSHQHVVGESFYQPTLAATAQICQAGEEGRRTFPAYVVAEPANQYDADAVAVYSDLGKVGHLSREDAQRYKEVMTELSRRGYAGAACIALLNGGEPGRPSYGVVLKLGEPRSCEDNLGLAAPTTPSAGSEHKSRHLDRKTGPGMLRGKHFTEYPDEVRTLRRYGKDDAAEELLLELVDATEADSAANAWGVAPWYYEQLAIIYKQRKDYRTEVAILERFASRQHAHGAGPTKLMERLEKARQRVARHEPGS